MHPHITRSVLMIQSSIFTRSISSYQSSSTFNTAVALALTAAVAVVTAAFTAAIICSNSISSSSYQQQYLSQQHQQQYLSQQQQIVSKLANNRSLGHCSSIISNIRIKYQCQRFKNFAAAAVFRWPIAAVAVVLVATPQQYSQQQLQDLQLK